MCLVDFDSLASVALLLLALAALGCFMVAFAVGRALRTRSTVISGRRERPPVVVQVIVWLGLAILVAGAFVWLYVLGHGF